ncbi:MAG: 30S ribosomal protein S18 [Alphaproteobacteria bacterium]|jgi:small subunit ribosomal protein S6|nr:30S ribosomal protein S18 [Alphaproteobacteria bacterium]
MLYEYVYLLRGDLSPNQVQEINNKAIEVINSFGGTVHKTELLGLRNLAYKIKKNKRASYVLLQLETPFEGIKELQRLHSVNENVLRTLNLTIEKIETAPSMLMKQEAGSENEGEKESSKEDKDVDNITLKNINYKNLDLLQKFTSERGKILPRRLTMATAKQQRDLAQAIKRARFLALISALDN